MYSFFKKLKACCKCHKREEDWEEFEDEPQEVIIPVEKGPIEGEEKKNRVCF